MILLSGQHLAGRNSGLVRQEAKKGAENFHPSNSRPTCNIETPTILHSSLTTLPSIPNEHDGFFEVLKKALSWLIRKA
jgi:hypothetical protein